MNSLERQSATDQFSMDSGVSRDQAMRMNQVAPPTITLRRPSQTCQQIQASQSCLQSDDIYPKCTDLPAACQPTATTTTTAGGDQHHETSSLICFCGFYSEKAHHPHQASLGRGRKMGRCKFCRSKAKYLPGQGSLDAMSSRIFRRRGQEPGKKQANNVRAASVDGEPPEAEQPTPPPPRPSPAHRPPPLHRQHRMEVEEVVPPPISLPSSLPLHHTTNDHFPEDIRGYTHIPGPPPQMPRFPHGVTVSLPLATLAPLACTLDLQTHHTQPTGHEARHTREARLATFGRVHSAPPAVDRMPSTEYPASPPHSYEEVLKQPRGPPPSYDATVLGSTTSCMDSGGRRGMCRAGHSLPGPRTATLTRSPAQDIPDIYWEQAARELDFCTCRKCQARYRQYFEAEENSSPSNDSALEDPIIPMETQVFMQEIMTDGMAFCSLM